MSVPTNHRTKRGVSSSHCWFIIHLTHQQVEETVYTPTWPPNPQSESHVFKDTCDSFKLFLWRTSPVFTPDCDVFLTLTKRLAVTLVTWPQKSFNCFFDLKSNRLLLLDKCKHSGLCFSPSLSLAGFISSLCFPHSDQHEHQQNDDRAVLKRFTSCFLLTELLLLLLWSRTALHLRLHQLFFQPRDESPRYLHMVRLLCPT